MILEPVRVESDLAEFLAAGHSRTRATELTTERAVVRANDAAAVVLVEGVSDAIALEIIASRCGRSLRDEQIAVVPMGGATNVARFVASFRRRERDVEFAGLYDVGAESHVRRTIDPEAPGVPVRRRLEDRGFYACVDDLEDELIRSLGVDRVEQIVEEQGRMRSFRKMQHEPHHRGRERTRQLHRFIGRWRYRYARLLAEAVDVGGVPRPIERLLTHLATGR